MPGERKNWRSLTFAALVAGVLFAFLVHLGRGSEWISPLQVVQELLRGPADGTANDIVWAIRLQRALYCVAVGALLGMVGSAFQALFRNPLADPYVVGVSSGAAVGGALAFVTGLGASWTGVFSGLGPTSAGFVTGLLTLWGVFFIARRGGILDTQSLLLAGVVVGSLLAALLSFILLSSGVDTNRLMRWLLGSMTPTFWNRVALMYLVLLFGGALLLMQSRRLNVFAIGEEAAMRLGVNVGRLKPLILITGTAMTAVTVGAVGIIAFLGLVAPHISRRVLGVDWRWSLSGSALVGALLLLGADLAAQHAIPNTELNVGIVTSLLGAPVLLVLLGRRRSRA